MALQITKDYEPIEPEEAIDSYIQECEQLGAIIQENLDKMKSLLSWMKGELEQLKSEKNHNNLSKAL